MQKGHIGKKGFTLIEIIITVAVLAIISIPLFQYFTEAAKQNARMKSQQNAMLAAQNTLEELKAERISITSPAALTLGTGVVSGSAVSRDWMIQATPNPSKNGEYTVKRSCTLNGGSYTVTAKVTPVKEVKNSSGTVTYQDMEIPKMDSSKDIIASERGTADVNAQMQFYNLYANYCENNHKSKTMTAVDFKGKLKKEICIKISRENTVNARVRVYYRYTYNNIFSYPDGIYSNSKYEEDIANKAILESKLSDIYVFYTPDSIGSGSDDVVNVDVDTNLTEIYHNKQLKLFIFSQDRTSSNGLKVEANGTSGNCFEAAYTNIEGSKAISGSMGSIFKKDGTNWQMIKKSEKNRIAEIEVSVYKGDSVNTSKLCTVNGSVTQ